MVQWRVGLVAASALALCACGGSYSGAPGGGSSSPNGGATGGSSFSTPQAFFAAEVQPNLSFCRTCHVPGGVADTAGTGAPNTQGNLFLLSSDTSQDYNNVNNAWTALGGGVATNLLLLNPSTAAQDHDGGQPWPQGSQAYNAMQTLLSCWNNPSGCAALLSGSGTPVAQQQPLLGSAQGGHLWDSYCANNGSPLPDSALLPPDPRTLVVPGVNQGKAVYMNAWWQTCQSDDTPANCGALRARVAAGYPIVAGAGQVGAGTFFSGSSASSVYAFPASSYNNLWKVWGLSARPDNFDQLAAERWGTALSPSRNPYPLPGEDPNKTNGGSGQLPEALTQLRNADGSWTGNLNVTCSVCHGGQVGTGSDGGPGPVYGTNSLSDITVFFTDLAAIDPAQAALSVIEQNKVRGTGNITNFQLFGLLTLDDLKELPYYPTIQTQPSTGTEDPPVWWNAGHRPGKFFDGGQTMDSKRIELSFHFQGFPANLNLTPGEQWIVANEQNADAWIDSLKAPSWPYGYCSNADGTPGANDNPACINTPLAEQGAVLFHSKNLWAANLDNPVPKPDGGNGSCAGCHGAYSPRYVNDPTYLDTPALEGIAAYIVPQTVIATDPARLNGNSQAVAEAARHDWFAYADGPYNSAGIPLCADQNDTALRGSRALGYLAPPLYGVWATAPYFHNGSVPNVWQVLKPADRPLIWERQSNTPRADQAGKVVMGFDPSMAAYDTVNLGWNYTALNCGDAGTVPYLNCNPSDPGGDTFQDVLDIVYGNGGLIWNLANLPPTSNAQIEQRKIYNTYMYSQGNAGHEFTAVLTDQERKALIEYLKTL
jgi:endo-cleaving rubber dioxygenase